MSAYRRCRGFTLIELLVVIAIIGILASMVFPVFARARESARKAVCLSNVRNIALAIQMYLADNNDTFPPAEHRQEVLNFFETGPGGGSDTCGYTDSDTRTPGFMANMANPYLRWPVVLDEYVKNRQVWQCPSAKVIASARFIIPMPDWRGYLQTNMGAWGESFDTGPCFENVFPSGWGGEVTDSIVQQRLAGPGAQGAATTAAANKTFVQGYASGEQNFYGKKLANFQDVTSVPVIADGGMKAGFLSIATIAYPDICCAECAGVKAIAWGGTPENPCQEGSPCDPEGSCAALHTRYNWAKDTNLQKASARHLGGDNIGYADGHASWIAAQALAAKSDDREIEGVGWICPTTNPVGYTNSPDCNGTVPAGMIFLHNANVGWEGK